MLLLLALTLPSRADVPVYVDALASGWSSWSWTGTYDFSATDVANGKASIKADADAWGALSLHDDGGTFPADVSAVSFAFAGDASAVSLMLEADGEGYASTAIALTSKSCTSVSGSAFDVYTCKVDKLGTHAWTRVDLMDVSGFGTSFHVDDVTLVEGTTTSTTWDAAEPLGVDQVVLYGAGDVSQVTVTLNGADVPYTSTTLTSPDRAVLALSSPLAAGTLVVATADGTFTRTLTTSSVTLSTTPDHPISPRIYGQAFTDPATIASDGISVVRWGGNAVTLYNPNKDVTQAAFDWYFENRTSDDADDWVGQVQDAGAEAFLTVPALDWVAKDATSYSYSVSKYGNQQSTDPWHPDAGNGVLSNGTIIDWNDPTDSCEPWTTDDARAWLEGMPNSPEIVTVDNEMDIAAGTHMDVHPDKMTYDELVDRWYTNASMYREVLPTASITGPASCCWWYYWNSDAGSADKAAHGGEDVLPWFLDQVAAKDAAAGVRTLDYLDVHYYPNDVFSDAADDATRAERLRATRGLWDPTYQDEGWIGTDVWSTQTQPSPQEVMLIPRLQTLISAHYPGTKLAIGEWNFGAEEDVSGGLAVADVLGIFGREGLDMATYWTTPPTDSPAEAGFALYRRGQGFGDEALPVDGFDSDVLGVYAAADGDVVTLVVVNKDPDHDVLLSVPGLTGSATVRHFGGAVDGSLVDDAGANVDGKLVVPAYSAALFRVGTDVGPGDSGDTGTSGDDTDTSGDDTDTNAGDDTVGGDTGAIDDVPPPPKGCGCDQGGGVGVGWLVGLVALAARRRR